MASRTVTVTRLYLEMRSPSQLRPARVPSPEPALAREARDPKLWRHLYETTGEPYHWVDWLPRSERDVQKRLDDAQAELWTARVGAETVGWFELDRGPGEDVELGYFGLLPAHLGRGFGGWLLTRALERAWALAPPRVWLHTCNLDAPAAIPNYLARGLVPVRWETYETQLAQAERDPFPLDAAAIVARGR